jgi:putative tryptophan/tyrosine transport system substrate-binding protein
MHQIDCTGRRPAGGHCWRRGLEAGEKPVLDMRRRDFISLLGGVAAWPLAARAQQPAMPVIGFMSARSPSASASLVAGFRQGLTDGGYFEGQNVAIDYRWAEGHYDRLPGLAADLVQRKVALIAAVSGTPTALAAKAATATIPIVFANGSDPVASGLVASLNRPGGNITGATFLAPATVTKRLEILRDLVTSPGAIAFLVNPNNPIADVETREADRAARALGLQLQVLNASNESDIDTAFAILVRQHAAGLLLASDVLLAPSRRLVVLTARHSMPAISPDREFAVAGGLMSYGGNQANAFRQAGIYSARLLKGDKPADLPVLQATKFELIVNLATAKALGVDIPPKVLAIADEVIE